MPIFALVQKRERLLLYYREAENKLMNGKFWLEEALKLGEKRAALLLATSTATAH